jgi:hypothetical protein
MLHLSRAACLFVGLGMLASTDFAHAAGPSPLRPFRSEVYAVWDNVFYGLTPQGAHFSGISVTTHMGKARQNGSLFLLAGPDPNTGLAPGKGTVTIKAANGSTVSFDYEGTLNAVTGQGLGTFTFTSGTGRFANVTGGGTFEALIDLRFPEKQPMKVKLAGQISY